MRECSSFILFQLAVGLSEQEIIPQIVWVSQVRHALIILNKDYLVSESSASVELLGVNFTM